eukprot:10043589-Karenia_brevis.AAC.1
MADMSSILIRNKYLRKLRRRCRKVSARVAGRCNLFVFSGSTGAFPRRILVGNPGKLVAKQI